MKQIIEGHRAYRKAADRRRAIAQLRRVSGGHLNHFVCYRHVVPGHDYALTFGHADWAEPGSAYTLR